MICQECNCEYEPKVHTGRWGTSSKSGGPRSFYCSNKCSHHAAYKRNMVDHKWRLGKLAAMAKNRAKSKNLPYNLTQDYLEKLWEYQEGRCILSDVLFVLEAGENRVHPHTVSIDRIVPELGYVEGNVRLVTYHVNIALGEFGERALMQLVDDLTGAFR